MAHVFSSPEINNKKSVELARLKHFYRLKIGQEGVNKRLIEGYMRADITVNYLSTSVPKSL